MSMKYLNEPIGNRTRDLPTCSAVPQQTTLPPRPAVASNEIAPIRLRCQLFIQFLACNIFHVPKWTALDRQLPQYLFSVLALPCQWLNALRTNYNILYPFFTRFCRRRYIGWYSDQSRALATHGVICVPDIGHTLVASCSVCAVDYLSEGKTARTWSWSLISN